MPNHLTLNRMDWEVSQSSAKAIVFDIHPNEFIDESDEKRLISRRSNSFMSYFLKDLIRSKLKSKNLGDKAVPLYENEIQYFQKRDYKFLTIKEYCLENNLILEFSF